MNVAVIGAGMTGLVAALRLLQAGHEVTVFERDAVPGGLAAGFVPSPGGAPLERFYHHIFRSDKKMIALVGELGLEDRLEWSHPATMCYYAGTLTALDTARALLAFDPLPPADRLRLGAALGVLKLSPRSGPFERLRALPWLRAIAGRRATGAIFEPLFRAKFGAFADSISLGWFWARIHDRTPELGYLRGGFAALYEALASRVAELGGAVAFGRSVANVERSDAGFALVCDGPGAAARADVRYDRVIATIALRRLASISKDLPEGYARAHEASEPLAARCVILALDRPLTGKYWINVCEPDWPFMVVVEHTALTGPGSYGGDHLLYIGNYGPSFPKIDARELAAGFEPFIRKLNPEYRDAWIRRAWQFVAPDAQPIVSAGYRERLAPFETPVEGLFVANLSQVYPHDRGQNYAVDLAEKLVARIR